MVVDVECLEDLRDDVSSLASKAASVQTDCPLQKSIFTSIESTLKGVEGVLKALEKDAREGKEEPDKGEAEITGEIPISESSSISLELIPIEDLPESVEFLDKVIGRLSDPALVEKLSSLVAEKKKVIQRMQGFIKCARRVYGKELEPLLSSAKEQWLKHFANRLLRCVELNVPADQSVQLAWASSWKKIKGMGEIKSTLEGQDL